MACMTYKHSIKRFATWRNLSEGMAVTPTDANLKRAKKGALKVTKQDLALADYKRALSCVTAKKKGVHPVTKTKRMYFLGDRLHQRNVSKES